MKMGAVFYVLWLLVHGVIALIARARDLYLRAKRALRSHTVVDQRAFLHGAAKDWSKLPEHVTVLLPMPTTNNAASDVNKVSYLNILVQFVQWALILNIPYISFHDPLGNLHKVEEEFKAKILSSLSPRERLIYHGSEERSKNGFSGPKIHVKILSGSGRASLVETCKHLAMKTTQTLTVPLIAAQQTATYEFPDPQLAVYFGRFLSVDGYPPWQIRLTEFVGVPAAHLEDVTVEHFADVLHRYNQCEQRVGK